MASQHAALQQTVESLRQGLIVAVKGLGGFHLLVDAGCAAAVDRLRRVKQRPDKPLALMYPDLALIKAHCQVSPLEATLLQSPAAPIVLLRQKPLEERQALAQYPRLPWRLAILILASCCPTPLCITCCCGNWDLPS